MPFQLAIATKVGRTGGTEHALRRTRMSGTETTDGFATRPRTPHSIFIEFYLYNN